MSSRLPVSALALALILMASTAQSEPKIAIGELPSTCEDTVFFAEAQDSDTWRWNRDARALLSLTLSKEGEEFVARFTSPRGERILREKDCVSLMLAAAAIAPLLWQEMEHKEDRPTFDSLRESPETLPTAALVNFRYQPSWVMAAGVQLGIGGLPSGARGIALGLGREWHRWAVDLSWKVMQSDMAIEQPNAGLTFLKTVLEPSACATLGLRLKLRGCVAGSAGLLSVAATGMLESKTHNNVYLDVSAVTGLDVLVGKRYGLGLDLAAHLPVLGRRYRFTPSPEVYRVSGLSAEALISLHYFFSDRL